MTNTALACCVVCCLSDAAAAAPAPVVSEQRFRAFLSNWQAAGCPGGRVLAPLMLSTVMPHDSAQGSLHGQAQGVGSAAPGFSEPQVQAFGSLTPVDDLGAAAGARDQAERDPGQGSGPGGKSDDRSDRVQGSAAGFGVDEAVARLGPWAVDALRPGGPGQQQPLLRQVVGDLASGRHPVTHNFCFEEHQSPVVRRSTLVLAARNKNNLKRAAIKFYTPRSPGYAAETSAYYQMASRHLPFLESTFNAPDGSYASALVLECGDRSLQDTLQQQRPTDLPRKLEMFHQLVLDVRHMHSHNLVHRDLQPRHLLFCSEGLAWKLIDFSTTVTANCMVVPEVFSLEYCAPEVAAAVAGGDRAMVACGAADMWAVGVIAYQLATGQPFYPASWSNEDIWRALLGLSPLPSERVDIMAHAAPGEKAYMKKVSLLLQRSPMQRLTAERLASSRMFSAVTATTTNVPLHEVQQAGK
ncbi:kinase-like domain-containing protein [Scenedesmus sp. NREL 46B-D3]|nr:kinase-like domain-containing protein [Scenedesmus sp. NREL 46B-D3]